MTLAEQPSRAHPSRRRVLQGAAWATPVVLGVAPAPVFAASTCQGIGVCPDISFGALNTTSASPGTTNGSGTYTKSGAWTYTASSTGWSTANANQVGFCTGSGTRGTQFAATAEPTTSNRILTLSQTGQPALQATCTYKLSFGVIYWYTTGSADLVVNAYAGNTIIASWSTAGRSGANVDAGIQTFTVPAGSAGVFSWKFLFGTAGDSNDITIYTPTLTCS